MFKKLFNVIIAIFLCCTTTFIGYFIYDVGSTPKIQFSFITYNSTINKNINYTDYIRNTINDNTTINVGIIDNFPTSSTLYKSEIKELINKKSISTDNNESVHGIEVANVIKSLNPNANIYAYALNTNDSSNQTVDNICSMIEDLVVNKNVKIINLSIGYSIYNISANGYIESQDFMQLSKDTINKYNNKLEKTLTKLLNNGYDFLLIKSAGNDSHKFINKKYTNKENSQFYLKDKNDLTTDYIATGTVLTCWDILSGIKNQEIKDRILIVGGTDDDNVLSSYSNYDNRVDVLAPSESFNLPYNNNDNYQVVTSGTSFSAPVVTCLASCLSSANPVLNCKQLKQNIVKKANTVAFSYEEPNKILSKGIVNYENTLSCYSNDTSSNIIKNKFLNIYSSIKTDILKIIGL